MIFIDDAHKEFYKERNKNKKMDVYHKSLIYALGISEITRKNYKDVYDEEKDEIDLDALNKAWQTGTTLKITRLAFNLWNDALVFDKEEDMEYDKYSKYYSVSEIFACTFAPFFWEAIKIRYPEYT